MSVNANASYLVAPLFPFRKQRWEDGGFRETPFGGVEVCRNAALSEKYPCPGLEDVFARHGTEVCF